MRVVDARNVHQALPKALKLLGQIGVSRDSRNGAVLVAPTRVTTSYARPVERVIFWPQRDANPAFHLYEALWMLAGRNDLAPLLRYVKTFGQFSDDGVTLAGAYGYRWRSSLGEDQLYPIANRLREAPEDRRCVLQMWQGEYDLGRESRDVPCNLMVTFQRDHEGRLDMTVFCRSNDIILGCYGANAVHFSMLQEYMAVWIGCEMGTYEQVSVNWHAYAEPFHKLTDLPKQAFNGMFSQPIDIDDPYVRQTVKPSPLAGAHTLAMREDVRIIALDRNIRTLIAEADSGEFFLEPYDEPFFDAGRAVLKAHHLWRTIPASPARYVEALAVLDAADQKSDWVVAMTQWVERRRLAWERQQ